MVLCCAQPESNATIAPVTTVRAAKANPVPLTVRRSVSVSRNGPFHAASAAASATKGRNQIPLAGDFKDF
jgi:hypothetical protein